MESISQRLVSPFDRRQFLVGALQMMVASGLRAEDHPLRIACLDWALTEILLAIGKMPIAMVAASDWNRFVVEPPLPPGIADLGLQQEINFELLADLRPDLILTSPFLQSAEPQLQKIGKVLHFSIFEHTAEPLGHAQELTQLVGDAVGYGERAKSYLAESNKELDLLRDKVRMLRPPPVLLVSFIDPRHVRVYGGGGLFQNVLDRLAIQNAWVAETNYWGYATVGIERLVTDRKLLLIAVGPVPSDVSAIINQSPLWSELPFVKAGQTTILPPVFMFGALPSARRFARVLVEQLEDMHS